VYLSTSTKKKASPLHVPLLSGTKSALALCEQLHSVDKSRVHQVIGVITNEEQKALDNAIAFSLGIDASNYRSLFKKWENYIKEYHLPVIDEYESIANSTLDKALENLHTELKITKKERDGWKVLAEANQELIDQIRKRLIL
jgi:hypothetical protein